ncbi:MAG: hypothetical protein GX640_15800, partial [Fibrobacter sp.]|nr:hypothetical protein [Fibrobacter sp.]
MKTQLKRNVSKTPESTKNLQFPAKKWFLKPDFLFGAGLFLLTIIFYWPVISLQGTIWNDFIEQYFPYRIFASRALKHFTFPFWNPYSFA